MSVSVLKTLTWYLFIFLLINTCINAVRSYISGIFHVVTL